MPLKFGNTTIDVLKFNNTTLNLLKYKENASAQAVTVFRSKHKIKFAAGGGTGSMSDQTLEYDDATNINENKFTKQYYTFDKWSGSNGITYSNKQSVNLKLDSGQYITLTATWKPTTYTITYDSHGGNSVSKTNYNVESDSFNLPTPSRQDYKFEGWFTGTGGTGTKYTKVEKGKPIGTLTLHAHWSIITPSVSTNYYSLSSDTEIKETESLNLKDYNYLYVYMRYHNPYQSGDIKLSIGGKELRPSNHAFWTGLEQDTKDSTFHIIDRIDITNYKPTSNVVIKVENETGRGDNASIQFKIARSVEDIPVNRKWVTDSNTGGRWKYWMDCFTTTELVGAPRGVTFDGSTVSSRIDYTEKNYTFDEDN